MIQLHQGNKIAIVSLSRGLLGEASVAHSLERGMGRLKAMGLEPVVMPHSLDGIDTLAQRPDLRAQDLLAAVTDPDIQGILCAIGGDDTYKLTPYLLRDENKALIQANPKFFMGYSDSTINHLTLYKLGLHPYYGLSFITCFAELGPHMLSYSQQAFENIFTTRNFVYEASPVWYEERRDFSPAQLNQPRIAHSEKEGYVHLQGPKHCVGHLLGGCLESLYELLTGSRYMDEKTINETYQLFPSLEDWTGALIFLETSEEKLDPAKFKKMITTLQDTGMFDCAAGVLFGKTQDEVFNQEYQAILKACLSKDLTLVANMNFGHAYPKMLLQYGAMATLDMDRKQLYVERL